jgi:aminoglycoside phosphotransferase (APT) family kinase protein
MDDVGYTEITGAEFYVMGFVEGRVLGGRDAGLSLPPEARARAGDQVVDVLVALHARSSWGDMPGCPAGTCRTCRTGWRSRGGGRHVSASACGPATWLLDAAAVSS